MALDLSAGALIRAGSGLLYLVLAVVLLARRRPTRPAKALGLFSIAYGTGFVLINLVVNAEPPEPILVPIANVLVGLSRIALLPAAAYLAWTFPKARPDERPAFIVTGLFAVAWIVVQSVVWLPAGFVTDAAGVGPAWTSHLATAGLVPIYTILLAVPLLAALRYAQMHLSDSTGRQALVAQSLGLALMAGLGAAADSVSLPGETRTFLAPNNGLANLACVLVVSVCWLWASARRPSRPAVYLAVIPLAGALIAMLGVAWLGAPDYNEFGLVGIGRILGWLVLVTVCLKHPDIALRLSGLQQSRSTVAMGALATLFIVAQIAQNFFSAKFGLLLGGVLAGSFVFAASPIQRAIERSSEGAAAKSQRGGSGHAEAAYRNAVTMAYKDRRFTQKEELALADLAETLGLGARRATEIRHEIEGAGAG